MDEGENFNETSLTKKKNYSNLDMEDITNSDHNHAKWVCKDYEIKNCENITICILKVIR